MTNRLLTADERANLLNLINETLESKGINIEVAGYEDDGIFFNVQLWKRNPNREVTINVKS